MNLDQSTDVSETRSEPGVNKIRTTLEDLHAALNKLQAKCCNEEPLTTVIEDFKSGDFAKVFDEAFGTDIQETSEPDENKDLIVTRYYKNRSVKYTFQAKGSSTMKITDVRLISDDCILVKWLPLQAKSVIGYEICVDGTLKSEVRSTTRTKAVLFDLNLEKEITIDVYAVTPFGLHETSATAILRPEID